MNYDIIKWLKINKIFFEEKDFEKKFSCGKQIAFLLKNILKDKINMNNYIEANSYKNKWKNWEVLRSIYNKINHLNI